MRYYALFFCLLMIFAVGCSSGTNNSVEPLIPAEITAASSETHQLWGFWQFEANPDEGTLDVVPLREAMLHLNALPFLEPPPMLNLTLESLQFNGNIIEADIGLRHPFLGLNEFTGFDVCGVLISNGSVTGYNDPDIRMTGEGDTRLLNPDGWTRWWNPAEFPINTGTILAYNDGLLGAPDSHADFNSTLNGYKLFCDDLADPTAPVSSVDPTSRCEFSAGQKNVRHFSIEMGGDGLVFNYAVDANWMFPQGSPPWDVPDDFAPGANRPESWNVAITEDENTLWNDGAENGGDLSLLIDVWDHFDAGLNTVWIDSPGNFPYTVTSVPVGGNLGYSTYQIDIIGATPAVDSIEMLIGVECEQVGYQELVPGKTVTSYFKYTAEVDDTSAEIICGEAVHTYEGQHFINGISYWPYCQRDDLTILETGAHAGECVVKSSYGSDSVYTGTYIRFDPDNATDVVGTEYFTVPGREPDDTTAAYVTMNPQIDQNPVNAHIGVVNGRMFDTVQIVDEDGVPVENIVVTDPATPSDKYPNIPGMDFDGDGDLWIITDVMGGPTSTINPVWQLRHYELQTVSPYYVENMTDRLDITMDLVVDYPAYPRLWYLADLAISYEEDFLFTWGTNIQSPCRSVFVKYDLSTSPPTKVLSQDLLPFAIAICSTPYSGMSRGDIEIDHSDPLYEKCRILVMYQKWNDPVSEIHYMKLDSDFNILADEVLHDSTDPWFTPFAFTINTDPDNRNLIAIDYNQSEPRNDFHYYTMPVADW